MSRGHAQARRPDAARLNTKHASAAAAHKRTLKPKRHRRDTKPHQASNDNGVAGAQRAADVAAAINPERTAALKRLADVDVSNQARLYNALIGIAGVLGEDARVQQSMRAAVTAILRNKKLPMRSITALLNSFFGRVTSASAPPLDTGDATAGGQPEESIGEDDWRNAVREPFRLTTRGVEHASEDAEGNVDWSWICSALEVRALTRTSDSESWGRLLTWCDPDGHAHDWAMPAELLAGSGTAIRAALLECGLSLAPGGQAARHLSEYLAMTCPRARVRCVPRCGWHEGVYVFGNGTFPNATNIDGERVVLQTTQAVDLPTRTAGTLAEWQHDIARLCVGNSRLAFALSMAFAAPLLDLVGDEGGGFHFCGRSSTGKTTAQRVAGSAWGGGGKHGWLRTWRATANGLESVAAAHCDGLLVLDELGQASGREVGETIYMLAHGQAKARARGDGTARRALTWRTLWFSSGEVGLRTKMLEAGQRSRAGQEVRLIEITADAGTGHGIYENLHEFADGAALTSHLGEATRRCYGVAISEFLRLLAARRDELAPKVAEVRRGWVIEHCPAGADGQVQRVADRCGLVATAGELARSLGILPWEVGVAMQAAEVCFNAWLAARGGTGPAELAAGVEQVRLFMEQHSASRFAPTATDTVRERAGFIRYDSASRGAMSDGNESWPAGKSLVAEFLVLPAVWRAEVCRGHDSKAIAEALADMGHLRRDSDGKLQARRRVSGVNGTRRYYVLLPSILGDDVEGDDADA